MDFENCWYIEVLADKKNLQTSLYKAYMPLNYYVSRKKGLTEQLRAEHLPVYNFKGKINKIKATRPRCSAVLQSDVAVDFGPAETTGDALLCQTAAHTLRKNKSARFCCAVELPHARVAKRKRRDHVALPNCRTDCRCTAAKQHAHTALGAGSTNSFISLVLML